ncbi:MAG: Sec-independent protein translocase protein TatC [Candidatus Heimdallarchaeota archaeon LC_3]|nr:MAG: Sec-independent protein translocase protein TatC [Candidatus Heimdallarchaeota archaeon LC_3]
MFSSDNFEGLISENVINHSQELYIRIRLIIVVFIISTMIIIFLPYEFIKGNFSLENYKPLVIVELEWILNWSTSKISINQFALIIGSPMAVIIAYIELGIITSFAFNYPFIIWQLYIFLKPGLYEEEKEFIRNLVLFATLLFIIGALIGFYIMPIVFQSLVGIGETLDFQYLVQYYNLNTVVEFFFWSVIATGILFTYPLFLLSLVLFNLLSSESLRTRRRHIIIGLMGITAIITPDPSPISMLILSVPLVFLYEITINLAYKIERTEFYKRMKEKRSLKSIGNRIGEFNV